MKAKRRISLGLLLSAGVVTLPTCALADHTHKEPHWTYEEQKKWSLLLDPTYSPRFPFAECGIGQKQSPINIDEGNAVRTDDIDDLEAHYIESPLSLSNNGHTIRVNISKGTLRINKTSYDLLQFHFHAPSEHHLNGVGYPLEIHFVNGTVDSRVAALGVFIQVGEFNEEFQKILDASPTQAGATVDTQLMLDPARFLPKTLQHFYTYAGSLTTPPCTEGIQWYVLSEPIEISAQQIEAFTQKYYYDNARVEQKLNGRRFLAH